MKCSGKSVPRKILLKSKKTIKEYGMDEKHFIKNNEIEDRIHGKCDDFSVDNHDASINTVKEDILEDIFEQIDKLEQKWSHQLNEQKNDIRTKMK